MPKELNDLSDQLLSHWFPTAKNSHASAAGRPSNARDMGETGPNQMKM
jgi:hypothetical protein